MVHQRGTDTQWQSAFAVMCGGNSVGTNNADCMYGVVEGVYSRSSSGVGDVGSLRYAM